MDGTSNTAIFSEWIKGTAVPTGRAQDGLAEVYNLGENSNFYTTDFQFAELCNRIPITAPTSSGNGRVSGGLMDRP